MSYVSEQHSIGTQIMNVSISFVKWSSCQAKVMASTVFLPSISLSLTAFLLHIIHWQEKVPQFWDKPSLQKV